MEKLNGKKINVCEDCGKQLNKPTARWCKEHGYVHRKRPSGLKYNLIKENPTTFKPGFTPWNKGKTGVMPTPWNKDTTGMVKSNSGSFTSESTKGENNKNWKGDNVGYGALHSWVYRTLGKASVCRECGGVNKVQWANISKQYKRDVSDWKELCYWCHRKFDMGSTWGAIKRRFKSCAV